MQLQWFASIDMPSTDRNILRPVPTSGEVVKSAEFDAIVIGSGATGGWAAKELCEAGLKTLMLDRARIVFLCASCVASNQILLNSRSEAMPNGLGNTHDVLGRYVVDHVYGVRTFGTFHGQFEEYVEYGRRPTGFYIPRFRNLPDRESMQDFARGYGYQGAAMSSGSCVNPTLTLMAMTARAADRAVDLIRHDAI